MSRSQASTVASRQIGSVADAVPLVAIAIPEDRFHRARSSATAHTSTYAGETFVVPGATFVRINDRHFRIEGGLPLPHAETLALIARSGEWRRRDAR